VKFGNSVAHIFIIEHTQFGYFSLHSAYSILFNPAFGCNILNKPIIIKILRKFELIAVQGHQRSSILVPIESTYVTSY